MQVEAAIFGLFCHALISTSGTLVMMPKNTSIEVIDNSNQLGPEILKKRVESAHISCQMRSDPKAKLKSPSVTWKSLDSNATVSGERIEVSSSESDSGSSFESWLTVKYPRTQDMTAYRCIGSSGSDSVSAVAAFVSVPLLLISTHGGGIPDQWSDGQRPGPNADYYKLAPDLVVHSGWALTLVCDAVGGYRGAVTWYRQKSPDANDEVPVGNGSRVHFPKLSYTEHRGYYVCRSSNQLGSNSYLLYLRVSNPKAYLAPLIILLLLIVAVVAVTVAYEIRTGIHNNQRLELTDESGRLSTKFD